MARASPVFAGKPAPTGGGERLSPRFAGLMRKDRHKRARIRLAYIDGPIAKITIGQIVWCGDRRTVVGRQGPVFTGLEFGGFIDVPHRVSIKKSAIYGFQWNRIGTCEGSSESYDRRGINVHALMNP